MGSHSVTCYPTQVNTPRLTPANQAGVRFTYPGGMDQAELTQVTCYIPRWFTRPQPVTHPSTNRAQCRLTSLIKPTPLTTTLRRHHSKLQSFIHSYSFNNTTLPCLPSFHLSVHNRQSGVEVVGRICRTHAMHGAI